MESINELATARDAAGSRVEELENKQNQIAIQLVADPEAYSDEDITKIKNDLSKAIKVRDFAQTALDNARKNLKTPKPVVGSDHPGESEKVIAAKKSKEICDKFVSDFKNMVTSQVLPEGSDKEGPNAGLTIPVDVQTAINKLKRSFTSLENLVKIENVSMISGSRVYEKLSDVTPFTNLDDETAEIGENDSPQLTIVRFAIHRYAGISTITNTLLKDSAENILAWIEDWIARKDVITRNTEILKVLNNGKDGKTPTKVSIADFDSIKDLENNTLDPLIQATSSFITNQSGYNVLSKVKDAEGRYLIQPSPTLPDVKQILGHNVTVITDKFLPDIDGAHPLYFGDYHMAITLYDYQRMTLVSTNIGGGAFEKDLTKIRAIDRFDVELLDEGAYVISTFTKIKDQESRVITGGSGAANSTNDSDASADGKADTKSTTSSKSTDTKTGK
ncbi:phage major capsid protein [Lactobacillus kimbladii]|uniref:phage major capsid protein n=3 Tax=Bacillati TaxID=1783272 RepID=UPI00165019E3|nr:phage major capsid protein [Lactobacillus kimbladii]MBC6342093.1 phage major capsid protein [Lactobacillus kimbladii]